MQSIPQSRQPAASGYEQLPPGPRTSSSGQRERSRSAGRPLGRHGEMRRSGSLTGTLNQPPLGVLPRQKDKFVPLSSDKPPAASASAAATEAVPAAPAAAPRPQPSQQLHPAVSPRVRDPQQVASSDSHHLHSRSTALFEDLDSTPITGRITVMTVAESFNRQELERLLKEKLPQLQVAALQEVIHVTPKLDDPSSGDVFLFDYGTVVFWGITAAEEQGIVHNVINPCKQEPLPLEDVEIDEFEFNYSMVEPPHVQNDVITINKSYAADHQVKLAISHALAQSTKLGIYEERIRGMVEATRHLPVQLAEQGTVSINQRQIARLIGQVFLQRAAVNLLGSVMDTPEFFWSAPDYLQVLYKRVTEYLELQPRLEVLNSRYGVLQELLDMIRHHINNRHAVRLEWVVIWLIFVEVVLGVFEVLSLVGFFN